VIPVLQRILVCALLSGLGTGVVLFALHAALTVPLIMRAESYEARAAPGPSAVAHDHIHAHDHAHEHAGHAHGSAESPPPSGLQRAGLTLLATVASTVGFALMLAAVVVYAYGEITLVSGIAFALAAFAATGLATGLGLAPELPGSATSDLVLRQTWWIGTATATASGLAALVFGRPIALKMLGLLLIVAPHLVGAPGVPTVASSVPAELSALCAARSLALQGLMWVLLGLSCGWIWQRQDRRLGSGLPSDGTSHARHLAGGA
jgi:cobalt transporter subunit CbtA